MKYFIIRVLKKDSGLQKYSPLWHISVLLLFKILNLKGFCGGVGMFQFAKYNYHLENYIFFIGKRKIKEWKTECA